MWTWIILYSSLPAVNTFSYSKKLLIVVFMTRISRKNKVWNCVKIQMSYYITGLQETVMFNCPFLLYTKYVSNIMFYL